MNTVKLEQIHGTAADLPQTALVGSLLRNSSSASVINSKAIFACFKPSPCLAGTPNNSIIDDNRTLRDTSSLVSTASELRSRLAAIEQQIVTLEHQMARKQREEVLGGCCLCLSGLHTLSSPKFSPTTWATSRVEAPAFGERLQIMASHSTLDLQTLDLFESG
ncbi:hypothetical protein C8J57DRAFT_1226084 [Mycena rebaudengoi]|nr:hypothetical protein C8J57DRAFT_1226084 [Mycena rebaudengoi]